MNVASTIGRIAAVIATASALTALAGVAQAATSRPANMSKGEYRALTLRSQALNQKYALGQQGSVPDGMTASEQRASMLRSEALNQKYGLGKQEAAAVPSQPTSSTRGFAWGAFGIGAVAMFGLAALAVGFFVRRRILAALPRARTSP